MSGSESTAVELVHRLAAGGRLSHAYVISGSDKEDRLALANALARALVCQGREKPCGVCPHCKKVLSGIHPDVVMVGPEEGKTDIRVDQIRALRTDAYVFPNEAARKVYVIDPACAMNPAAQNALLKVLEEGPDYAAFLLLAEIPGALLTTVRSRCEHIALSEHAQQETAFDSGVLTLADRMLGGSESALMEHCVELEKLEREELRVLLEQTMLCLTQRAKSEPNRTGTILPKIELLKELHRALDFHVSAGHLAGWLCAAAFTR